MESLGIIADHQEQIQTELDLQPEDLAQAIYGDTKTRLTTDPTTLGLAQCSSCHRHNDPDDLRELHEDGPKLCDDCRTTWWDTRNPHTGQVEIPNSLHPGGDLYPSMNHALGFIDAPEGDHDWNATWLEAPLELNEDRTAVRPEGCDEPWATLHDRRPTV